MTVYIIFESLILVPVVKMNLEILEDDALFDNSEIGSYWM